MRSIPVGCLLFAATTALIYGQQPPETTRAPAAMTQRVGVAPNERPSCQLAPVNTHRRHMLSSNQIHLSSPAPSASQAPEDSSSQSMDQSASGGHLSLMAPTVMSLEHPTRSGESPVELQQSRAQQQPTARQMRSDTSEKLRQLRQLLVSNNYDAYLVTPNDEHGSEYVSDYDRRLRFLTGFTGSNGYALVLLDRAVLFTDGRYALQADNELDCNWWLVVGDEPLADIGAWLKAHATSSSGGLKIAIDARLMSLQSFDYLDEQLRKLSMEFVLISQDLVDVVWSNVIVSNTLSGGGSTTSTTSVNSVDFARPVPSEPLFVHPIQFAGNLSWQEKVARLTDLIVSKHKARHYVISQLDDIAWLLNLRGLDIPMSPLFKSFVWLSVVSPVAPSTIAIKTTDPSASKATTPTVLSSMEQLLNAAASIPSANNNQQQTTTTTAAATQTPAQMSSSSSSSTSLLLQQPQVLQVQTNRLVRLILYVDQRKIGREVREHLRLDPIASNGSVWANEGTTTRIQVELRDYESFIGDLRDKLSSPPSLPVGSSTISQQQIINSSNSRPIGVQTSTGAFALGSAAPPRQTSGQIGGRLLLDAGANVAIHVLAKAYTAGDRLILVESLCSRLKSVKTDLEVDGMRRAHWRDSLAISMLLAQLDKDISSRGLTDKWSETSAADELTYYRSLMDFNRGLSFETISAYGPNAAVVHYKPATTAEEQELGSVVRRPIRNDSTYLLDSGGQYLDGTTDITRTLHFGKPTNLQRETYTRVLMGAIDMMSLVFDRPSSRAPTYRLNDLIARRYLLEIGLDYAHGTGHGIGAYSMVHEAPALIEHYTNHRRTRHEPSVSMLATSLEQPHSYAQAQYPRPQTSSIATSQAQQQQQQQQQVQQSQTLVVHSEPVPLQANMFTSVEPGYYRANEFGIRLENIVVTQLATELNQASKERQFLRFEPLSLVPFEPKLIKFELLSNKQKAWLNSYNLMVRMRMTQQINHYLSKIRQYRAARQTSSQYSQLELQPQSQVRVDGTTASSRLYQRMRNNTQALAHLSVHEHNFLRMDLDKLQYKLEQTHRWILDKTSLVALDLPATMVSSLLANGSAVSKQANETGADWSGEHPIGQRLMLAYMSAAPFSDTEAAQTAASLVARSDEPGATGGSKCTGLECDLWLLEALNSQPAESHSSAKSSSDQSQRSGSKWIDRRSQSFGADESVDATSGSTMTSFLEPLFQLSNASPESSRLRLAPVHIWWLVGFASLVLVQLVVIAMFVCGRKRPIGAKTSQKERSGDQFGSTASYSPATASIRLDSNRGAIGSLGESQANLGCNGCTACASVSSGRITSLDE